MKGESIAECSLEAFCNTFDLHHAIIGLEKHFLFFFLSGRLSQVLLYLYCVCEQWLKDLHIDIYLRNKETQQTKI